jgi:hypothetical protein
MHEEQWNSEGYFWVDESEALPGFISYSAETGAQLRLTGVFGDPFQHWAQTSVTRLSVVQGSTKKHRGIFLLDVLERNRSIFMSGGMNEALLSSTRILTTETSHDVSSALFLRLGTSFRGLDEWLDVSGFQVTIDFAESFAVKAFYRRPDPLVFHGDDFDVEFKFTTRSPVLRRPQTELMIKQFAYLEIIPHQPKPFTELFACLVQTSDLISLAMGSPLSFAKLNGELAIPTVGNGWPSAEIWLKLGRNRKVEEVETNQFLFTLQEVKDEFQGMLKAWGNRLKVIEPTYNLYFAVSKSTGMHVEHRLFNLFQALESYHQRLEPTDKSAREEARKKRDAVLAAAPLEAKQWLKEKLAFCLEPTAAERIKDLVKRFEAEWIFPQPWEGVVQRIAKIRNYLTHYRNKPPDADLKLVALHNFGSMLQVLCEVLFLCELGFPKEKARAFLTSKRRLQSLTLQD